MRKKQTNDDAIFRSEYDEYEQRLELLDYYARCGIGWIIIFVFAFQLGAGFSIGACFLPKDEILGLIIAGVVFLCLSVLSIVKFILARKKVAPLIKQAKNDNQAFVEKYGSDRIKREEAYREELDKAVHRAASAFWEATKTSNCSSSSSSSSSSGSSLSSSSSTNRDCYHDGKGIYRTPGEGYYDSKGVYREQGDDFFDGKGILRKSGESYFDSDGDLRNPGESYVDSKGNRRS
ncbi:MAG: hypothetical protein ACI4MZ_03460 [Christensenellales bacterium]